MKFNNHRNLEGKHAIFSASQPAWLRYDDEKLITVFNNLKAKEQGTKLHAWAKDTIDLGIKQPKGKKTLYQYVNDAIGFGMSTEVVLYYSDRFYGTADAICFRNNMLRIHDLKTGRGPVHLEQLMVYAALFCLEYKMKPESIDIELRIYQNDDILIHNPGSDEIREIMDLIARFDELLQQQEED